jgi:hypothetical protein
MRGYKEVVRKWKLWKQRLAFYKGPSSRAYHMENGSRTARMIPSRERPIGGEREGFICYWRLFEKNTWDNSITHQWGHPRSSPDILSLIIIIVSSPLTIPVK